LFSEFSFLEFSGLHYCLFVKVLCAAFSAATVDILSHVVLPVKHFFNFLFLFVTGLTGSKNDSIIPVRLCQSYFYIFLQKILQWLLQ